MKKNISGVLAAVMLAAPLTAYAEPAQENDIRFADKETEMESGEWKLSSAPVKAVTNISYTSAPSYIVTIPANVDMRY